MRFVLVQIRGVPLHKGLGAEGLDASDGVRVAHTSGLEEIRGPRQREIQGRRPAWFNAIEMRIKCIVQQYVAGTDAKPAPGSAFLIPSGKDKRRIRTRMNVSGLPRPAVALFAVRGYRGK